MRKSLVLSLGLVFSLINCTSEPPLNGAGATFPYPVYSAWAHTYSATAKTRVNYQSIGSGGGIKQITERTVHFGASDKPLSPSELEKDKLLQFPAVIGGVVLVYNLSGIKSGELRLDSDAVANIFLGNIKKWNDDALKQLNPSLALPDKEINVVRRSDGSGTTAIFTDYLSKVSPSWKEKVGTGTAVSWPYGIGGKGNEGVASYVNKTQNSVGFVEFAYAKQNQIPVAQLKNAAGKFVEANFDTFSEAAASGDFDASKHFFTMLNNAPGENAWPIAGATYILLASEKSETNKKVVAFFRWAFENGDAAAKELTYVPLPESLKNKIKSYWKTNGLE